MGGENPIITEEALRRAEQEGIFKGQILTSLQDIKRVLDEMRDKHTMQDTKIELKVDKKEYDVLTVKVDTLQRYAYMGLGAVGLVEFLIVVLK